MGGESTQKSSAKETFNPQSQDGNYERKSVALGMIKWSCKMRVQFLNKAWWRGLPFKEGKGQRPPTTSLILFLLGVEEPQLLWGSSLPPASWQENHTPKQGHGMQCPWCNNITWK